MLFLPFLLLLSTPTLASDPILFGHNLTPTTYSLRKNQLTVGTYAIAYGVTDHWTLGTSPWMAAGYNMVVGSTKYSFLNPRSSQGVSLDLTYFKTLDFGRHLYRQDSIFTRTTFSQRYSSVMSSHFSLGYQYFWDDSKPYSLRLIPSNGEKYCLSLSSLNEFRFNPHAGALLETGVMGLNYNTPYLHLGASIYSNWDWGMLQLGVSRSSSFRTVQYTLNEEEHDERLIVLHPEIQFQAYF